MKSGKVFILFSLSMATLAVSACSQNESDQETTQTTTTETQEEASNQQNVKGLVDAINDPDVRYKMAMDADYQIKVITSYENIDDETYGFDDPEGLGTSINAYADQSKMNARQSWALRELIMSATDEEGELMVENLWEYFPDDGLEGDSPNQGAYVEYATLSNVETKQSEDNPQEMEVTADVTVHVHLSDGSEDTHTFKGSAVPEAGNNGLGEQNIERATNADVMNEELPW